MIFLVLFTVVLLASLLSVRSWLHAKRLAAAADQKFWYRRFLTPEERKRRESCLARYAEDALIYDREIGVILPRWPLPDEGYGRRPHRICLPYYESPKYLDRWMTRAFDEPRRVWTEEFQLYPIRSYAAPSLIFCGMLVDPEDEAGLTVLCERFVQG